MLFNHEQLLTMFLMSTLGVISPRFMLFLFAVYSGSNLFSGH